MTTPTNAAFYKKQLSRFIQKWHVSAIYHSKIDDKTYPIRLNVGKYNEKEAIGDIDQRQRRGIISVLDFVDGQTPPQDGDKIQYLDQKATIDFLDPRIEVGEIIGYDLTLRGS